MTRYITPDTEVNADVLDTRDIRIEYPMVGATYTHAEYGVYAYDEYEDTSVLAGQTRRTFLDRFPTLDAARAAYPTAYVCQGSGYVEPSLHHLPDDNDW